MSSSPLRNFCSIERSLFLHRFLYRKVFTVIFFCRQQSPKSSYLHLTFFFFFLKSNLPRNFSLQKEVSSYFLLRKISSVHWGFFSIEKKSFYSIFLTKSLHCWLFVEKISHKSTEKVSTVNFYVEKSPNCRERISLAH